MTACTHSSRIDKKQVSECLLVASGKGEKDPKDTFREVGFICYIVWSASYISVYICQNS